MSEDIKSFLNQKLEDGLKSECKMIKMLRKRIKTLQNWESGLYLAKIVLELSPHLLRVYGALPPSAVSIHPLSFTTPPAPINKPPEQRGMGHIKETGSLFISVYC